MSATAALVGTRGPHSGGWLETLRLSPDVDRLIVCDVDADAEPVPDVDAQLGSMDELLRVEDLDLAVLSLRNDQYPDAGRRILERGIPAIIEKPAAQTAAEIAAFNDVAAQADTIWATGFLNRMQPLALELRSLVQAGVLGRIVSIEGRMVTSSVQQRTPDSWLFSRGQAGGGILHWLGIHTIDMIRFLTGLEYTSVGGNVSTLSDTEIDVEDMAALSFTMTNGALGNLHAGYVLRERYGDIGIVLRGTVGEATWVQYGFEGTENQQLKVRSQAPGWEGAAARTVDLTPETRVGGYGGEVGIKFIADFLEAASAQAVFVTNGVDALKAMQVVEAAYEASETGRQVDIQGPSA